MQGVLKTSPLTYKIEKKYDKGEFGMYTYKTKGTCSALINIEMDENHIIQDLNFVGGCNGNLQGISQLVVGMKAEDVIGRLEGIHCGFKPTSCPDQLAHALRELLAQENH